MTQETIIFLRKTDFKDHAQHIKLETIYIFL